MEPNYTYAVFVYLSLNVLLIHTHKPPVRYTAMRAGLIGFMLFLSLYQQTAKAQSQLDWLQKQAAFKPILKAHLKETGKAGCPTVSIISFSYTNDTLTVFLSSITYLSELEKDLPADFKTIHHRPFLVYDGSEELISDKQTWFEKVKRFAGQNLCDDLTYQKQLEQPGPRKIQIPCCYLYHPTAELLTFWQGRLVKRRQLRTG